MEQNQTIEEEKHPPPDTTDKNGPTNGEKQSEQAEAGKSEEPTRNYVQQETASGAAILGQGPMHVTINYNYASQDIRRVWERPYEGVGDKEEEETGQVVLKENVRFARQNRAHFDTPLPIDDTISSETPLDDEQHLSEWYYGFDEYVQCYVLAVTLLHGATAREIYRRTDELYRLTLLEKQNTLEQVTLQQDSSNGQMGQMEPLPPFAFPRPASLNLHKQTGTLSYRENGAERLFWRDVTNTGYSTFEVRMLTFLAREYNRKGEHWNGFFQLVRSWSEEKRDSRVNVEESSWRSALALGAILWYQNIAELRRLAEEWAKRNSFSERQLATSLLYGAYEIEQLTQGQEAPSAIHQLLQEWIVRLQRTFKPENVNLGCSVATTYGLIVSEGDTADIKKALRRLDDLLRLQSRLDDLLRFQKYGRITYLQRLMATVSSAYVSLSLTGHVRQVLHHLAHITKELVYSWDPPQKLQDSNIFRWQRKLRLDTALDAFFFIAEAPRPQRNQESLWDGTSPKYLQPLEAHVPLPDPGGRDILLVGLLTEDTLVTPLITLLCAAMFSRRSKPVSELLTRWASIIRIVPSTAQHTKNTVHTEFIAFLVNLGLTIQAWGHEMQRRGYRQSVAYEAYRQQLLGWTSNKRTGNHPLAFLGEEALHGLEQKETQYKQPEGRAK